MGYSGMVSDSGSERMAGVRRIGGLSASMHRLTVSRCIPNSLAMPRIDRPFRLASCTTFHLSLWRKVGLPAGMGIVIFSGASSIASSSHSWDSSGICCSASVTAASGVPRQLYLPVPVASPKNVTKSSALGIAFKQRQFRH